LLMQAATDGSERVRLLILHPNTSALVENGAISVGSVLHGDEFDSVVIEGEALEECVSLPAATAAEGCAEVARAAGIVVDGKLVRVGDSPLHITTQYSDVDIAPLFSQDRPLIDRGCVTGNTRLGPDFEVAVVIRRPPEGW